MKDAMNAAFGQILEQANAEPEISSRFKGRFGKMIGSITVAGAIAVAAMMAPTAAFAQNNQGIGTTGCIMGGIVGGLLGHQIGNGSGRDVATGAGAIAGCVTGSNVQTNNNNNMNGQLPPPPRPNYQQRGTPRQVTYEDRGYDRGGYDNRNGNRNDNRNYGSMGHPMANYAPACFAQWNGQGQPNRNLSPEAQMAMQKGERSLGESYSQAADAQNRYFRAYENVQRVNGSQDNPYNNMNSADTYAIRNASARANSDLNQLARQRQDAERIYAGTTLRVLDACEMAASRGEDVTPYAKLQAKMTLPMKESFTIRQPATGQNIRVITGGQPARLDNGGDYDNQPRSYRP